MKNEYAIYFVWNDGFEDSVKVTGARDRDIKIKDMLDRKDFFAITYCIIYANGDYGMTMKVI